MPDIVALGVRFAQYADLTLLFGLALFCALAPNDPARFLPARALLRGTAILGLLLTGASTLVMAAGMAGVSPTSVDWETLSLVMFETPPGKAAIWRGAALLLMIIVLRRGRSSGRPRLGAVAMAGAIALATLAWNGHGAASEGNAGILHLGSDIVHLLAAGAWIGALGGFILLLAAPLEGFGADRLDTARRALDAFSLAGSIIVGLIVMTGLINAWLILGADNLPALATSLWGQLLMLKLLLFFAMLGLAAVNRFRLTPRLERAILLNDSAQAVRLLRISLAFETSAALVILALIAWLGMISPNLDM